MNGWKYPGCSGVVGKVGQKANAKMHIVEDRNISIDNLGLKSFFLSEFPIFKKEPIVFNIFYGILWLLGGAQLKQTDPGPSQA